MTDGEAETMDSRLSQCTRSGTLVAVRGPPSAVLQGSIACTLELAEG